MKKLTATFPDGAVIDLQSLMAAATDFKIETIPTAEKKQISRHVDSSTSVPETIMEHFTPLGQFSISQAEGWVSVKGYNPKSATSALHSLAKTKNVGKMTRGHYQFLKPMK